MIRKAFLMTLEPGQLDEYRKRHNPIWPELADTLKKHGVCNYSIYFDQSSNKLFAYAEIESENLWQQIANTDVCQRWWFHMKDLMLTNVDSSPATSVLQEVFHLD